MSVHPTAVVDPKARLGAVRIGPHAVIEGDVELADGVEIGAGAVICDGTRIGPRTRVGAHAVLGGAPQHRDHDGSPTRLTIGADNDIRELVTAHRGSSVGRGTTAIGDGNLIMVGAHVGHDTLVGSGCTVTNGVALGGHVEVEDEAVLGGMAAVHPWVRVGRLAMVAGGSMVSRDVPPFSLVQGNPARLIGLNRVGLERSGRSSAARERLRRGWRALLVPGRGPLPEELAEDEDLLAIQRFLGASRRGICRFGRSG